MYHGLLVNVLDNLYADLMAAITRVKVRRIVWCNGLPFLHQLLKGVRRTSTISHLVFLLVHISCVTLFHLYDSRQTQKIRDAIAFDFLVQGRITAERWRQVDFEQPGRQILIYENIKSEDLKTITSFVRNEHVRRIVNNMLY
jgi:hypothetical protein